MNQKILKNNHGQGLIEYIIIVSIVAVGAISLIRVLNQSINVQFAQISKALGAKTTGRKITPEVSSGMLQKKDLSNFMRGVRGGKKEDENNDDNSLDSE